MGWGRGTDSPNSHFSFTSASASSLDGVAWHPRSTRGAARAPRPFGSMDMEPAKLPSAELELRLSALKPGDHLCLIYETPEEQFAAAIPFMRDGLAREEQCLYIADERTVDEVRGALRAAGVDVEAEEERGALRIATKRQTYLKAGSFDPEAMINLLRAATVEAVGRGYKALRATGEMTWALGPELGTDRLIEYEALLNDFFPTSRALAICQYSRRRFSAGIIHGVLRTHPIVILGSHVCRNPYYEPTDAVVEGGQAAERVEWMIGQLRQFHEIH